MKAPMDHRYKRIDYNYDLISGNVKEVDYQSGDDQMHHRYTYDADNRINSVETSADALIWHLDADYFYYPHGPLERVELGEQKVQGMDYAYTLSGWLKGINSDRLVPGNDMGQDGVDDPLNANRYLGRDAFGESVGYYGDNDYSAIATARWSTVAQRPFAPVGTTGTLATDYHPLYNGNIAHTVNSLQPFGPWTSPSEQGQVLAQEYRYDQLNRLKEAKGVEGLTAANTWDNITDVTADRYKSQYTYDANGNILTLDRFDEMGDQYDSLIYHYEKSGAQLLRNRLYHLNESVNGGYGDIDEDNSAFNSAHADVNLLNNYKYDALGNLIADKREEIANIEWTVSGKVKHITRTTGSTKQELSFTYGADGQRMSKTVGDPDNGGFREWYVRDAQGNIMATYKYTSNGPKSLMVTDRPVYGSSRIGEYTRQLELYGDQAITNYPYTQPMQAPLKRYELTDHLGNVNTVVTGRLLLGNGAGSPYQTEVVSAQTLAPFGSLLPGRNYQSASYPWGLNRQMKDDEIYGATGTSYTAEFWQYDPRVGRRWNLDQVDQIDISNYAVFGLNPMSNVDPNGAFFFGAFGSTSHQREAARKSARDNSGEVKDYFSKSIHSDYTTVGPSSATPGPNELPGAEITGVSQYFNVDGSPWYENSIQPNVNDAMDNWSESQGFFGITSYSVVDGASIFLQSNPLGRMVGGSNVKHLNGSIADNNEVVDGVIGSLPVPGATLFGIGLSTEKAVAKASVTALARTMAYDIPGHGAPRLLERGITEKMAQIAMKRGERFFDPKNGSVNYLLRGGFASGKDLLIGTNAINGSVKTGIRGWGLLKTRMIPLK